MYFVNDEHKENFEKLFALYERRVGDDVQYKSSIYMAAFPEIYKCFRSLEDIDTGFSPLFELMEWNDEEERHVPVAPGLTGSTRRMVEFGVSCYTGYDIQMDDILGAVSSDDLFDVLVQTMKIRARK